MGSQMADRICADALRLPDAMDIVKGRMRRSTQNVLDLWLRTRLEAKRRDFSWDVGFSTGWDFLAEAQSGPVEYEEGLNWRERKQVGKLSH